MASRGRHYPPLPWGGELALRNLSVSGLGSGGAGRKTTEFDMGTVVHGIPDRRLGLAFPGHDDALHRIL